MKECKHYDNWCEKEKRTCNNCYYERGYNMSDEENKAFQYYKECNEKDLENYEYLHEVSQKQTKYLEILLNLIEKQSKEIEELKAINKKLEARKYMYNAETGEVTAIPIDNNYISKDKIRAKIEEIEKRRLQDGECELALHGFQREAKLEVLQSLLKKE